jgi:hypothetical protein
MVHKLVYCAAHHCDRWVLMHPHHLDGAPLGLRNIISVDTHYQFVSAMS